MVIGITALLILAVGVTAAVDLRRLHTPRGAALAWTEAATFGDCRAFLALSDPDDPTAERRTDDEICRSLRRSDRAGAQRRQSHLPHAGRSSSTAAPQSSSSTCAGPTGATGPRRRSTWHRGDDWLVLREPAPAATYLLLTYSAPAPRR